MKSDDWVIVTLTSILAAVLATIGVLVLGYSVMFLIQNMTPLLMVSIMLFITFFAVFFIVFSRWTVEENGAEE